MWNRSTFLLLLLAGLMIGIAGGRLAAQTLPAGRPVAAPASAPPPATLPAAQAQQALDVLRDDKRRAELIATLDAIAKAGANTGAPAAGSPEAAARLPLVPDSLGAQVVVQVSAAIATAGQQLVASVQAVNDLPLLWRWLSSQADNPEARARLLDAAWKLLVVMAAALAAEWAARRVLSGLRAAMARGAHADPAPLGPAHLTDESGLAAAEAGESERSARQRRLSGALHALRKLPFLFGRLLLDVIPIAVFALVSHVLLGTKLGEPATTRLVVVAVVETYIAGRLVLAVVAMLVSPISPRLRLLQVSDWAAAFLTRWIRRVIVLALAGYNLAEVGLLFGMYRTASEALLKLVALVVHACLVVAVLQAREPVARRIHARHNATGVGAAMLNRLAEIWHLVAIFYIVALWLVWAVELRNGYVRLVQFFLITAAVATVSRLVAIVLLGGLDRLRVGSRLSQRHPGLEARLNAYYPVLRATLMSLIGLLTAIALLEGWGFGVIGWFQYTGLGSRALSAVVLIAVTVLLAVLVWEGANAALEMHVAKLTQAAQLARAGRLRTLMPMLRTVLLCTIILIVALMTLSELGVNIAPLLAGAGVIGIAVGFGSQKLVQDLITGLFLLLENAMQVGDVVTLGGLTGTVEALSIRTIRLRAIDGSVHIIPFSAVTTVTNQTRDYGYAVLDVSVGLNEEPGRMINVFKEVAETMRADSKWSNILLEPLDVMGIEKFVDTAWVMRVRIKTQPSSRWAVGRELNRRIKERFDELAIESPFTSHRILSTVPGPARGCGRPGLAGMSPWDAPLREEGFLFVPGGTMQQALEAQGLTGWDSFARSWDDLGVDTYMADGGRYRKRRHAAFRASRDGIARKAHQPHYQSRDYNALNGGIARWFEPVLPDVADGAAFGAILRLCTALFDGLTPAPAWHVEAHQFRIEARPGQEGQPTPEGMHQDGVDWVLVLMIGRLNIASGTTTIHGLDRRLLGSFTLDRPMDAALLDDHRVFHGVTAVQPSDPAQPAHRDVLVLTFRRESGADPG